MKRLKLYSIIIITFIISGCSNQIPSEIIGKYYNQDDGSFVHLKDDGTFDWIADGVSVVNGNYTVTGIEKNVAGYKAYYTIVTEAKGGKYLTQWGVTDHIRQWKGYYDLRQGISGGYFLFKKRE